MKKQSIVFIQNLGNREDGNNNNNYNNLNLNDLVAMFLVCPVIKHRVFSVLNLYVKLSGC